MMSATILSITEHLSRRIFGVRETPEQQANRLVKKELRKCHPMIVAQAQARAGRHVRNGYAVSYAVDTVCKWARSQTPPNPPFAA